MTALTGLILFLIWLADEKSIKLDSLQSKPFSAIIARFATPKEPCFNIDDTFLSRYPALKEGIRLADEESIGEIYGDRYAGHGLGLARDDALSIISDVPFKYSVTENEFDSIKDESHSFGCIIQYKDNFYDLRIDFIGFNPSPDQGSSIVRITRDKERFGTIVLQPENATVWATFNNTVVWKNELSEKVTIVSDGNSPVKEFDEVATSANVIMPGQIWYFGFRGDLASYQNETYRYHVEPYNLRGVVELKRYPPCMTEDVARSLYSQTRFFVKFPEYLPEGYSLQCNFHGMNIWIIQTYWNKTYNIHENMGFNLYSTEGLARGVIWISAMKEIGERDEESVAEQWYKDMKKNPSLDASFLRINGHPAVSNKDFLSDGKEISVLLLFLDQEKYVFKGMIPLDELIKMAESLQ